MWFIFSGKVRKMNHLSPPPCEQSERALSDYSFFFVYLPINLSTKRKYFYKNAIIRKILLVFMLIVKYFSLPLSLLRAIVVSA
ncbi:MAG: hypothetical protein U5L45_18045 [Saprospiraceae bacterium]|nr:hypothetical protein [Saprospiraceae bacterium]